MAKRFPLVVDTENNNRIIELPIDDCLDLTGSDICSVENITVTGTITLPTGPVTSFTGNYSDLIDAPIIPTIITDLGINDGDAGQILHTNGNGQFYFDDVSINYIDITGTPTIPSSITQLGITDGAANTFLTTDGNGNFSFASITDINVDLGNITIIDNTIGVSNLNGSIILKPVGSGFVRIDNVTGLVIPVGTTEQRAPNATGAIRFNTEIEQFEGYNGSGWTTLGGVRSLDGENFIIGETTPGASDDRLLFFTDGVLRLTITRDTVDFSPTVDVNISNLTVGNLTLNQELNLAGNITIGDSTDDTFTLNSLVEGNLIPKVHDTYDIGSKAQQWQNLFVSERTILNGIEFPNLDGAPKSLLETSGTGELQWAHADRWGGNRVYVSAEYGDDNNDGITAPVRTIKRGLQIAGGMVFEPTNPIENVEYETKLLRNAKKDIADSVITWLAETYGFSFGYDTIKCRRDMDLIIDAILLDQLLNTNYNSITAGLAYQRANSSYVTGTQNLVTLGALDQLKVEISNLSVWSTVTNELIDSIVEIQDIFSNGVDSANNLSYIAPDVLPTPNAEESFFKLINNKEFIKAEIIAWISVNHPTLVYDSAKCNRDVGYIIDGLCHDILYGGNYGSITNAKSYFVGTQGQLGPGEVTATVEAYTHMQNVVKSVIQGIEITPAIQPLQDIDGNIVSQITIGGTGTITEAVKASNFIKIIIDVIDGENLSFLDRTVLPNFTWSNVRRKDAYNKIKREQSIIKDNVINHVNSTNGFYDSIKCHRDVMEIIDSVTYDLRYGGNSRSVTAGESYYDANNELYIGQSQKIETIAAIEYARDLAIPYLTGTNATAIETSMNLIASILDNKANAPTKTFGNSIAKTITVMVATGDYIENNPIIVPDNVSIIGDNLRRAIIRPKNVNRDLFRVRNGCYFTGVVFRDHVDANGIPDYTFRYGLSFDNPADTATSRAGYIDLPASRPLIFTSPYIQNCSIISFLGAGGAEIDGNLVDVPNIPPNAIEAENPVDLTDGVPEQGKSMVANAYTILSFGGNAWRVMNDAYAQIVSCFVIFCENGCLTQNGGYLSITNSASNFGLFSLRSTGYSPNSFEYDRGYSFAYYTLEGFQVLRVGGLRRAALEHYVVRLKSNDGLIDQTDDFTINGISENQKTVGFIPNTTSVSGNKITFPLIEFNGDTEVDIINDTIVFTTPHPYSNNNAVNYQANGNAVIGGLGDGGTYYVQVVNDVTIRLFTYDQQGGKALIDLTSASTGIHKFQTLHEFNSGDHVEYDSNNDAEIVGLLHELKYYVEVPNSYEMFLYHDEDLENQVRSLDASVCKGFQNWKIGQEYVYIEEVISTHNTYQDWQLPSTIDINGVPTIINYGVVLGNGITCTKSTGQIIQAGIIDWDPTNLILTVSLELTTENGTEVRNIGDTGTLIPANRIWGSNYEIPVLAAVPRRDLFTSDFKILTTLNTGIEAISNTVTARIELHRPSICNSSAHTWEFAGSGTDYNALPQNGGLTDEFFEQVSTVPGRVYSSGTNEIGDFKVGNFVRAYNRTGNIDFKNKVNIGILDSLALSLSSGIVVSSISNDIELGDNEVGGPSDSRLITQLSIYTFLNNRLGDFIDKKVSTNAIPSSVVQLNSSGQINSDLIPPTGNFTAYVVPSYGGRFDLHKEIPVVDLKAGDIVIEEYDEKTLTVSATIALQAGEILEQVDTNGIVVASGVVKLTTQGATEIKLIEPFSGTFIANSSAYPLQGSVSGQLLNGIGQPVYPLVVTDVAEVRENYFITTSRASQFLITLAGQNYNFTNTTTIQGAISGAVGDIESYIKGVLTGVDVINDLPGGGEYTEGEYTNVQILYSATSTGAQQGSEAFADITVNNAGEITTFDLRRGGSNYAVGETLTVATQGTQATLPGATFIPKTGASPNLDFEITITNTEDRLYVVLNTSAGLEFNASSTNIDFITDDTVVQQQLTLDAQPVSLGFFGVLIDTTTDTIECTGAHGLVNGDRVVYDPGTNTTIVGLDVGKTYYVKVVDATKIQLFDNYVITGLPVNLGSTFDNGTPHNLFLHNVNLEKNSLYIPSHGFAGGDAIKLSAVDPPLGLDNNAFYFIGSVTDNTFTLHAARGSAIDSVNGLTKDEVTILDRGTGVATLRKQNVIITGDANTSGQYETSWSNLTSTTIDADNIISGIINTARLATESANDFTFLRGDSKWTYAVQGITNSTIGDPITLSGPNVNNGITDVYYGNIDISVERTGYINELAPATNEAKLGVAGFAVETFKVTNGIVEVRNTTEFGQVDALTLSGQNSDYYRNPVNLTRTVPIEKGGTNLAAYASGDLLYAASILPAGNAFSSSLSKLPIGNVNDVLIVGSTSLPEWTSNLVLNGAIIDAVQIGVTAANIIDTINAAPEDDPWGLILNSQSGTTTVDDNLVVTGNLTVSGTMTTVLSQTVEIEDVNIVLAKNAANATEADGAGLTVNVGTNDPVIANPTITYTSTDDRWNINKTLNAGSNTFVSTATVGFVGNATSADKWATARTVTFQDNGASVTGVTGSFTIDGSANVNNVVLTLVDEQVQDIVGNMVANNTESGINVTYNDTSGTLNFNVEDPTITISGAVSGSAQMINLANLEITVSQQNNSVTLGTHTIGDYITSLSVGNGLIVDTDAPTTNVDAALDGFLYEIVSLGDTNWATIDAGGNNAPYVVGDRFVMANAPLTGTSGTVKAIDGGETVRYTIAHADTSSQANGHENNTGNTVIQSVGIDGFGHVTSIASKTIDTYSGFNIFSDTNNAVTIAETNTIKLVSGTNVTITQSAPVTGTTQFSIASEDTYVSGIDFNTSTGVFTVTMNDNSTYTKNLDGRYLTGFSETDTLQTVTSRTNGSTTTNTITVGGNIISSTAPTATLESTDANTNTAGVMNFRTKVTGAPVGQEYETVCQIQADCTDRTYTAEDAKLVFKSIVNGTLTTGLQISGVNVLSTSAGNGNLGIATHRWNTVYASTFDGTATQAQYADLAEMYEADEHYTPGTVMMFGGDKEVTAAKGLATTKVIGVVSTDPAYLMNSKLENGTAIALKGRVPCLVIGKVEKGDMLIASDIAGVAIATQEFKGGAIIGKAIEASNDTEIKVIEIAVGVL